jgi:hypothetical protein
MRVNLRSILESMPVNVPLNILVKSESVDSVGAKDFLLGVKDTLVGPRAFEAVAMIKGTKGIAQGKAMRAFEITEDRIRQAYAIAQRILVPVPVPSLTCQTFASVMLGDMFHREKAELKLVNVREFLERLPVEIPQDLEEVFQEETVEDAAEFLLDNWDVVVHHEQRKTELRVFQAMSKAQQEVDDIRDRASFKIDEINRIVQRCILTFKLT